MAVSTVAALLEELQHSRVLAAEHFTEVVALAKAFADPRELARQLVQRGRLTPFQVNQLLLGRGGQLVLGQYVLLERLGEGGMGQVFKARQMNLDRLVALKIIRAERLSHPDVIERFRREAKAAAHLAPHPNLVTIFDADEAAGTHFFAMEFVEGTDLAKLLAKQGPLPPERVCHYIRQAALGLQHACEHGLVHRDIKPANLILAARGETIKILDMGLARLERSEPEAAAPLTREGSVMGTPDYMSPEQARDSRTADIRSDIYSLGCTFYFLLTGRPPFPGGSLTEKLLKQQMEEPQPVEQVRPGLPESLPVLLRKMMAKRPQDRFQTPAEVAMALARAQVPVGAGGGTTVALPAAVPVSQDTPDTTGTVGSRGRSLVERTAPRQEKAKRRPVPWQGKALLGGGVLLLVLLLWVAFRGGNPPQDGTDEAKKKQAPHWPLDNLSVAQFSVNRQFDWPPQGLVLVLGSHRGRHWGPVRAVTWSRDGKLVASGGDDKLICVWKGDTLEEVCLLRGHAGPVLSLAFTPDGKRLLSGSADKTVRLWDLGQAKELLKLEGHTDPVVCLAVSSDGQRALSGGSGPVDHTVRVWNLTPPARAGKPLSGHTEKVLSVAFGVDQRSVVSLSKDRTIRIWDVDKATEQRRISLKEPNMQGGSLSQDGLYACYAPKGGKGSAAARIEIESGKALAKGFASKHGSVLTTFGISFDGKRVVAGGARGGGGIGTVEVFDVAQGVLLRDFGDHSGEVTSVALTADGGRAVSAGADGMVRLWNMASGEELVPRPGHVIGAAAVAFSTDGRYVLTGGQDQMARLWDLASSPPGKEVKRFEGHSKSITTVGLTKDGTKAVTASADGSIRVWELSSGKELRRFFNPLGAVLDIAISPDDTRVLSGGAAGTKDQLVHIWDLDTGELVEEVKVGHQRVDRVALSPDARWAAAVGHSGIASVWSREAKSLSITFPAAANSAGLAFSPDSRFLLVGQSDGTMRLWDIAKKASEQSIAFPGMVAAITSVAFAPDGQRVAAAANDGKISVWDAATQAVLHHWQMPGAVRRIAFSPDGHHLATANANGAVYILRLPYPQ